MVSCWVQFSDGAVTPLDLFDRGTYSLTVATPDESVATVRRTPQSTYVVAQGEGQGALVRVELRICEECQKSKRKSKLAVGLGLLQIDLQSSSSVVGGGGAPTRSAASELNVPTQPAAPPPSKYTVADQQDSTQPQTPSTWARTTVEPEVVVSTASSAGPSNTAQDDPGDTGSVRTGGRAPDQGPASPAQTEGLNGDAFKTDPPKVTPPKVIESDLIRTFGAMSDLEIGMYALVGVSCLAILAFLLNCTSHNLCFQNHKSPVQAGPGPSGDAKDHKHDWVWLGSSSHGAGGAPVQVSTLKLPTEPRQALDSLCHRGLPAASLPAPPERTATLGRNRSSSQQHFHGKALDPLANPTATLLVRPQRSEPLHSPTSKRNQVQFTTFTTLDIKHLSALKSGGDLTWTGQHSQRGGAQAQTPLADMPWPVVKPLGEPQ